MFALPKKGRGFLILVLCVLSLSVLSGQGLQADEPFVGWSEVPGHGTTATSDAAVTYQNRLYLFGIGIGDHGHYMNVFDGTQWAGWKLIPGGGTTNLADAATVYNGKLYLFGIGIGDHAHYMNVFDGTQWAGWKPIGGTTNVADAATVYNGKLYLFGIGIGDHTHYVNVFDGARWSGWSVVPGGATTDLADAAVSSDGKLYLFGIGIGDHAHYMNVFDGTQWAGWKPIGGTTNLPDSAAAYNGKLYLFGIGIGDHAHYMNSSGTSASYVARAPYDLVWDATDDNGFPLNPRWGKQDKYIFETGSHDLWVPQARPRIYEDCLNVAEQQTVIGVGNDYNPFRNGYCKHSPGVLNSSLNPAYCQGDKELAYQPDGPIYCASWSWKDEPFAYKCLTSPFNVPYHLEGHLNFMVTTYEGVLRWDNAQAEYNFDSDWCINLYTPHGVGVSGLHDYEPWIHTEVDPLNVGDGFDRGFWMTFRDNIHNGQQYCGDLQYCSGTTDNQNRTVAPMINGKRGILIGLLGLDMGHDEAGAELHPVYGTAIHTGGRTLKGSGCDWSTGHCVVDDGAYLHPETDPLFDVPQDSNDDTWAIWVANYGSEGYCSTRALHVLDGNESIIGRNELPTLSFRLPWAKDAAGRPMQDVQILDATNFALHAAKDIGRTDAIYDVAINHGANIVVTFHMWPSEAQPYWFGELHLKWQHAPGPLIATLSQVVLAPAQLGAPSHVPPEAEDHPLMTKMSPAQKEVFLAEMKKALKAPPTVVKISIVGTRRTAPPPPPPPVSVRASLSKRLRLGAAEEDAATRRALCAAYDGHVPNQPANFCQQNPR